MSLVSNSTLPSSGLHTQQHGNSLATVDPDETHSLGQADSSLPPDTDIGQYVNNNYHADSNNSAEVVHNGSAADDDDSPVIDIIINNVVSTFNTRCYLNLKKIAMEGVHVEYKREHGVSSNIVFVPC